MAWRFDQAVKSGVLDNTERGRVQVRLDLVGRAEPLLLDLQGDAWRDIAGTRLRFVNPDPLPQYSVPPCSGLLSGHVGDITASRKVKVFTVPEEEWRKAYQERRIHEVPTELRNSFYLEWFSDELGRCVVESADFQIEVDEHGWQMDEDEEAAQRMANMHSMREYLASIIQRPVQDEEGECEEGLRQEDFTEEKWEEQLKASDRLADAGMEAHDKYEEDEESDQKIAFVMGWDHFIEDLADAQEGVEPSPDDPPEKLRRREWIECLNQSLEQDMETASKEEGVPEESTAADVGEDHPLAILAREVVVGILREARQSGLDKAEQDSPDAPLARFLRNIMQVSGKLAAATGIAGRRGVSETGIDMDTGYALAVSKRCLNWINEAFAALRELAPPSGQDEQGHGQLLNGWRDALFVLRDGIVDFRRDLQKK